MQHRNYTYVYDDINVIILISILWWKRHVQSAINDNEKQNRRLINLNDVKRTILWNIQQTINIKYGDEVIMS